MNTQFDFTRILHNLVSGNRVEFFLDTYASVDAADRFIGRCKRNQIPLAIYRDGFHLVARLQPEGVKAATAYLAEHADPQDRGNDHD